MRAGQRLELHEGRVRISILLMNTSSSEASAKLSRSATKTACGTSDGWENLICVPALVHPWQDVPAVVTNSGRRVSQLDPESPAPSSEVESGRLMPLLSCVDSAHLVRLDT